MFAAIAIVAGASALVSMLTGIQRQHQAEVSALQARLMRAEAMLANARQQLEHYQYKAGDR